MASALVATPSLLDDPSGWQLLKRARGLELLADLKALPSRHVSDHTREDSGANRLRSPVVTMPPAIQNDVAIKNIEIAQSIAPMRCPISAK